LGHLLQEGEGLIVDVVGDIEWDKAKKVMVFSEGGQVRVVGCNDDMDLPDGQMLWVHKNEDGDT
jgi:hypothetical protein